MMYDCVHILYNVLEGKLVLHLWKISINPLFLSSETSSAMVVLCDINTVLNAHMIPQELCIL